MRRSLLAAFLLSACFVQEPLLFRPAEEPGRGGDGNGGEACGNGLDDDGDGFVDEGCPAEAEEQACYPGPPVTRTIGACRDGLQRRLEGGTWGPCLGAIVPGPESCGDEIDADCDGLGGPGDPEDAGCCVPAGEEVCNRLDDDCDGLADEGVTNACGRCLGDPCYDVALELECEPGKLTCEGAVPELAGSITLDPEAILEPPAVVVGDEGSSELLAVDPDTLEIRWRVPGSPGARVAALRGGHWILDGTRLVRRTVAGEIACEVAVRAPGPLVADVIGRALVIAGDRLQAFDPDRIREDGTCAPADVTPFDAATDELEVPQASATHAAVGLRAVIWSGDEPATRIDPAGAVARIEHAGPGPVAVDGAGAAWFAGSLHRVAGTGPYVDREVYESRLEIEASAIAPAGDVVALAGGELLRISPGLDVERIPLPAGLSAATQLATSGAAAFVAAGELLGRRDRGGWTIVSPARGPLRLNADASLGGARRLARLEQVVDGGWWNVQWLGLRWRADVPPEAAVIARVAFADRPGGLAGAPRCGPFLASPADLRGCAGADRARYLWLEVLLATPGTDAPVLHELRLISTRP